MAWQDREGHSFKSFARLRDDLASRGQQLIFALNAGMYDDSYTPVGLYVEKGKLLQPLNTRRIEGSGGAVPNFYKQPNGVFYLSSGGGGILPTDQFAAQKPDVLFATQSGPMLVTKGAVNPLFIPGSSDRRRRSRVGICEHGKISFLVSDDAVNFFDFATVFRDTLRCDNALFLDGGRGAGVFDLHAGREDISGHGGYGPMIVYREGIDEGSGKR
ncbi:phosphodiester glycosidase family protein [Rhizobium helianthi]|uniref:Phosphodiester glycosidase family protein n=1 Tax=Rhizobium helianthi TaxID=1132695 RepID=A0ABW4M1P5_9HYPH